MTIRRLRFLALIASFLSGAANAQMMPLTPCCENRQAEGLIITDSTGVRPWTNCILPELKVTCRECVDRTRDSHLCPESEGSRYTKVGTSDYPRYYAVESPIGVSPSSLYFRAYQGGSNPASQTLSIYNNIYERWSIDYDLSWNASESLDWLSLSATSGHAYGTTPTSTIASANIVGKGVGTYSGNIVFSSSMVSSLQNTTVPTSLTVAAQLAITITGSTELEVDETGSWTAGVSGGFTPYHYQ